MALDPRKVGRSYDAVADHYHQQFEAELEGKPLDRALLQVLGEDVAGRGGGPVLDAGGGPGHVSALLRNLGARPVLLDLSHRMVSVGHQAHNLRGVAASMAALPLASASLAGAVAFYSLIHLDDQAMVATSAELHRVLRPGAPLLVSFHVGQQVVHLDDWWDELVDLDFRFLMPDQVRAMLHTHGFAIEAVLDRRAYPHEVDTQRCYILARRR